MNDNPAIKGLIELIEKRYGLEVLDSHYVLVDEKFKQYNISAMHVAWSIDDKDNIRFHAAIGNNILLLLDSLLSKE